MGVTITPNMNLPSPNVGSEPGPQYASDIDNCLSIIDGHTHAFGDGVQITPSGLNINSDLTIQNNNLTNTRTVRFFPQGGPITGSSPDLGILYEVYPDLYYNDGLGNQIRITQAGSIVGTSGSITGLTAPASATYSPGSSTFTWQSDVNTPATMDMGNIVIRNDTASSPGVTIAPNSSIASDYQLTLPAALPGATEFVTLDSSGNLTATIPVSQGIQQSMLAPRATGSTVGAGGYATSTSTGVLNLTNGSQAAVTNLSVTITTTGRPVQLFLSCAPGSATGNVGIANLMLTAGSNFVGNVFFFNGITQLCGMTIETTAQVTSQLATVFVPASSFTFVDTPVAGTYTYTVQNSTSTFSTMTFNNVILNAYEI